MNLQDLFENAPGAGNIGRAIKTLYKKIYAQGDDAVEFAYYDSPIFAQYWDEYEGDLDSIIAEVDPSELQIIYDELVSAAEDQGIEEGVGADVAKLGGIATLGIAGGLAGNYVDQQQPKVEVGGKIAFVEPAHSRVPDTAMTLTGKDGKTYRVWATRGTAQSPQRYHAVPVQGVKEGASDTVYPNATVIKSRNGKPVGEIYQDESGWGCFHYNADRGADCIESKEEAFEWLKDIADEYRQDRSLREGNFTKTPSGDYVNMHTGVRSSTAPAQKKVRGYKWEVHFDYGPHMSDSVVVTATSENEARAKAEKVAQKAGRSIMINWAKPVEQGVAEATGDAKFDSMLGNIVKDTPLDFVLSDPRSGVLFKRGFKSKEQAEAYNQKKERGYYSVYSYQWWRDTIEPEIPDFYRKQGMAEMDKGSPQPGRDGRVSHSTYGSRDKHNVPNGPDIHLGPESMLDRKQVGNKFSDILNKELNKAHKKGVAESNAIAESYNRLKNRI